MTLDQVIFYIYGFSGLNEDFWSVKIDAENKGLDVCFSEFNAVLLLLQIAFHTILVF